jgi:hypothetical protein
MLELKLTGFMSNRGSDGCDEHGGTRCGHYSRWKSS